MNFVNVNISDIHVQGYVYTHLLIYTCMHIFKRTFFELKFRGDKEMENIESTFRDIQHTMKKVYNTCN